MITSVYQKVLSSEFTKLSPLMQEVHGSAEFLKASGMVDVEYGKGIFIRTLNRISNLPPEGKDQQLELEVTRFDEKEVWKRSFNGKIFSTTQFEQKSLMIEKSGLVTLEFILFVKEGALYFKQKFTRLVGIRLPKFMGVLSSASAVEDNNGWRVQVEVRSPIFGLMLKYSGSVQLQK